METFELRYFLGVAEFENIHKAAQKLAVSPASLSKAVARLEEELAVSLFIRQGRGIRLSAEGQLLQLRASQIIGLEEATKLELSGGLGAVQVKICGTEILLSQLGLNVSEEVQREVPKATFVFIKTETDSGALSLVQKGEAHFALCTSEVGGGPELMSKVLLEDTIATYVGRTHPLYSKKGSLSVREVLEHAFVSPAGALLGKVGQNQSADGWRDDKFPRTLAYTVSSLKTLEEILVSGKAVACLPRYFAKKLPVRALRISDCPYTCRQKVRLVSRNEKDIGWIRRIF